MSVYISVEGKQIGPFDEDAVLAHLASGAFSVNDLAMREGDVGWSRLGDMFAGRVPVSIQVPVPSPLQTPHPFLQQPAGPPSDLVATVRIITKVLGIVVMVLVILKILIQMLALFLPQ